MDDFKDIRHKAVLLLMMQEPGAQTLTAVPIPPGADLWLTEEFGNDAVTFPLLLSKVSRKRIEFRCACRTPGCTRRVVYEAKVFGAHAKKEAPNIKQHRV